MMMMMMEVDSTTESESDNNIIRLSLKKPKDWKWSLTTSVSSPAVVVPVIQLWDSEQGSMLLDTGRHPKTVKKRSKTVSFEKYHTKRPEELLPRSKSENSQKKNWEERNRNERLERKDCNVKCDNHLDKMSSKIYKFPKAENPLVYRSLEKKKETKEKPARSLSLSSKERPDVNFAKPNDYFIPRLPVSIAKRVSLNTSSTKPMESCSSTKSTHTKSQQTSGIPRLASSKIDQKCGNSVHIQRTGKEKKLLVNDFTHKNEKIVLRNDAIPVKKKVTGINERIIQPKEINQSKLDNKSKLHNSSNSSYSIKEENVNETKKPRSSISGLKKPNVINRRESKNIINVSESKKKTSPLKVEEIKPEINKQRKIQMELCFNGPNKHRFDVRRASSAHDNTLIKQSSDDRPSKIPPSRYNRPQESRSCGSDIPRCINKTNKRSIPVINIATCDKKSVNNSVNKCVDKKPELSQTSRRDFTAGGKSKIPGFRNSKLEHNENVKKDSVKARRRRAESRHRDEKHSPSSSETETECQTQKDRPRRKRKSHNNKGDRLVGINGQCVRCPEEAGELLRESGEVVRLQLVRNGVGSQSLPRHRVNLEAEEDTETEMGSNMSRHSGKGLTGRRSQSSGNLCNGKIIGSNVGRFFSPCSRSGAENNVGPRDRYKFCGSLPNHLDAKDPADIDEVSETDEDSSFKNNNNVATLNNHQLKNKKNDVELRLHPIVSSSTQHVHQDSATNDQGYASERSPEEELPPDLPPPISGTCPLHHRPSKSQYPFINKNSTFTVTLVKGSRGLGLSVTGGVDSNEQWPGLIRIKRLFPHQPAWESGQLAQGDILLVANNTALTGLTNYEALEVLRTTPTDVVLTVCRPPPELQVLSAPVPSEPAPVPPRRDTHSSASSLPLPLKRETYGEFDVTLTKVNGSLGFTLRKEDESVLGHYVRALVREPALSDGRIKPGDKIVAVNDVDLSAMSHEEAVMFLRQCGQEVHLRLFRDPAQTPVAALSPTEAHRTFKPILRKEAQDMLTDLAVKKSMSPNDSTGSSTLSRLGRSSSPRKRRFTKTPSPDSQINGAAQLSWSNEVLNQVIPGWDGEKPQRPDFLNLNAERKPHFQFAAPYTVSEETGESCDEMDSASQIHDKENEITDLGVGPLPSEPVSMPPLSSNSTASTAGFSYRNPAYRSANPATTTKSKTSLSEELPDSRCSDNDLPAGNTVEGSKGLLKWKGVVFTPEDGTNSATSPEDSISQITETDDAGSQSLQGEGVGQVLVVELNRGWNSRLGFSLQQVGRNSVISAIYPDSVASRDGRLKPGDQLIMVNDESVEGMTTSEVIDLLRKIRGSICITVWRKS